MNILILQKMSIDLSSSPSRTRSNTLMGVPAPPAAHINLDTASAAAEDEEIRKSRLEFLRQRAMSIRVTDGNFEEAPVDFTLDNLFTNNVNWARKVSAERPGFFENLALAQNPDYLWYIIEMTVQAMY